MNFNEWMHMHAERTETVLRNFLPASDIQPQQLHAAMRYASLAGGKRVRPLIVYAVGELVQAEFLDKEALNDSLDHAAAALEFIHVYSLVHDDMPCMDNDALRRGRPTVHVQYDDATALLVGDALQSLAFDVLSRAPAPAELVLRAVQVLGVASGSAGMAGGQAIDLASVGQQIDIKELETMHRLKTGALLRASAALGGIMAQLTPEALKAVDLYAQSIGLAFQVVDDILDVTVDTQQLGKTAGKDAQQNKPTYVSLLGLDAAKVLADKLHQLAITALSPLGVNAKRLAELADFIVLRDR